MCTGAFKKKLNYCSQMLLLLQYMNCKLKFYIVVFLLYFEKKYYNVDITVGCYHHGQHLAQGHQKD